MRKSTFVPIVSVAILGLFLMMFMVAVPVGAAVAPDEEVDGQFHAWDQGQGYVVVDGRRYKTSESVQALGPDRTLLRADQIRWGTPVTLYLLGDEVYQILVHDRMGAGQ